MKEIRIYLADLNTWYSSSTDLDTVMECAESQGTVWSLEELVRQFNNGEEHLLSILSGSEVVMSVAQFDENGTFVKGIES